MLDTKSTMRAAALFAAIPMSSMPFSASGQDTSLDDILGVIEASPRETAAANAPAEPSNGAGDQASDGSSTEASASAGSSSDDLSVSSDAEPSGSEILDTIPVQTQPDVAESNLRPRRERPAQIEEIIVTATKREQSIREIPASITAFSGEKLEGSGKLNLNEFIQETPGVTATQGSPGFTRLTFRGISTDTNPAAGNAQPVGVFIGDVPFTDPYIANIIPDLSAFDLSNVEVLKGPQGTLFGGAALSGAIRYQLQEPLLDTWQFRGFSQYTQPKDGGAAFTHGVAFNAPLPDQNIALRMNYIRREYPGVMDNLRFGKKDVDQSSGDQLRAQLLWQPGDWKIKLTHMTQDFYGRDQLLLVDSPEGPRETNRPVLEAPSENDFSMESLEISHDFSSVRAVSLTSRVRRNANFVGDSTYSLLGTPPQNYPQALGVATTVIDNSESISQEFRLQSNGDGPFQWLAGLYYFDYEMFFNILIDTPLNRSLLGPGSLLGDNALLARLLGLVNLPSLGSATSLLDGTSRAESTEKAAFLDLSYDVGNFVLSLGGRFYETEVTGGFIGSGILVTGNQNDGLTSNSIATLKEDGFNPKLSATYRFTDDVSMYASAAKGFRFGGLQSLPSTPTNGVPPTYKSDTLWNYELGLRTNWLDNTLQADLTAFYIRYDNPIITQQTQGIPINYNTNVSGAVSRGLEGNVLWNTPITGLVWSLAGAFTDAYITKEFTAANGDVVLPGQEMPGAAKYQFSTSMQYLQSWGRFTLSPSLGYTYIGKGYSNITHDVEINDFGTLDAGVVIAADGVPGSPRLAINVSNVLDETAVTTGAIGNTLLTRQEYDIYLLNPPRTVTARVSVEF